MAKYKVGDKVTIRQWEDMEKEYGLTPERNIRTEVTFVKNMKYMCGNTYKVDEVTGSGNYFVDGWIVSDQMIVKSEKQVLVIYREENATIGVLKENGKEVKRTVAKLHPDDTYDFKTGVKLITNRMFKDESDIGTNTNPLYNGKVVCLTNATNSHNYTVGKIYEFKKGRLVNDNGLLFPAFPVHSFDEWKEFSTSVWLEIKE